MKIENYGVSPRCEWAMRRLVRHPWRCEGEIGRILLLPIPTSRDGEHITGTDRLLGLCLSGLMPGELVVGYGISERDEALILSQNARLLDVAKDEVFQTENARLTALGTLGHVLTTNARAPDGLKIGVVGHGRIGSALVRLLLMHGAAVTVYTSSEVSQIELGALGIPTVYMPRGSEIIPNTDALDLIINTAPTPLGKTFGTAVPRGQRVIELASGNNFEGVFGVERLMSIPDKMYPRSAGDAYFEAIIRYAEGVGV